MDERRRSEMENQLKDKEDEHERKLRRMDNEHAAEVRSQERKQEDELIESTRFNPPSLLTLCRLFIKCWKEKIRRYRR